MSKAAERTRRWREKNRQRLLQEEAARRTDPDYNEKRLQQGRKWYARNRQRVAVTKQAARYGMSVDELHGRIIKQQGLCASCGRPPSGKGSDSRLHVDHCHRTNEVRSLLCGPCNRMIGQAGDDAELLRRAASYLEAHQR